MSDDTPLTEAQLLHEAENARRACRKHRDIFGIDDYQNAMLSARLVLGERYKTNKEIH